MRNAEIWPALPFAEWQPTCETLHMWTQIVGKIRLSKTAWLNHSWHVTLYVTPRGLTTSPIFDGERAFQIDFDFIAHELLISTSDGAIRRIRLEPCSVASFYKMVQLAFRDLEIETHIVAAPNEVADAIPFADDLRHTSYDAEYANRFWRILLQCDRVFKQFRARFIGKCSPVHFFWGSFDLAVTRFSGRAAPVHPGGIPHLPDVITREAYSHEVSSCGFWPGGGPVPEPIFYSYAYPEPAGFRDAKLEPKAASYSDALHEFILPYEAVRSSADPDALLLSFMQTSYEAAATLAQWDRAALEQAKAPLLSARSHR